MSSTKERPPQGWDGADKVLWNIMLDAGMTLREADEFVASATGQAIASRFAVAPQRAERPVCRVHKTPKQAHYYCLPCVEAGEYEVTVNSATVAAPPTHGESPRLASEVGEPVTRVSERQAVYLELAEEWERKYSADIFGEHPGASMMRHWAGVLRRDAAELAGDPVPRVVRGESDK